MTSPTGETRRCGGHTGMTLIELILVMGILAIIALAAAPRLSGTLQARALREETLRFLALTQYARSVAVDEGLATCLWINPVDQTFGVRLLMPFDTDTSRTRSYQLGRGLRFTFDAEPTTKDGQYTLIFQSDGILEEDSLEVIRIMPDKGLGFEVALNDSGNAYFIRRPGE